MRAVPTPGRLQGRSGVFFFALVALLLGGSLAGCDALGGGATVTLDSAEVDLGPGTELHEVTLSGDGAGAGDALEPRQVEASSGDAVRFVVGDNVTHAVTFDVDQLAPDVRSFLETTTQLRGPPLVNEGAAWVVVLRDAPPGRYPFRCRTHDARGVLVVQSAD